MTDTVSERRQAAGRTNRLGPDRPPGRVRPFKKSFLPGRAGLRVSPGRQARSRAMLFDQVAAADGSLTANSAAAPADDAAARLLRHVLKVWAREQGVADADVPDLVDGVLDFAAAAALDGRFGKGGV